MRQAKTILICPLDWGLGHAGRMAALAGRLGRTGNNVIIAASDSLKDFFSSELPGTDFISFPGFRPRYSRHLPQYLILFLQIPILFYHLVKEHIKLRSLIGKYKVDIVISDNRFGLWNKNIKSVYVTHQIRIPFPAFFRPFEFLGVLFHRCIINRYSLCLIPDLPGDVNLTGRLSHGIRLPENAMFTGLLSRFSKNEIPGSIVPGQRKYYTAILSGPEPQKSIFKESVIRLFTRREEDLVVLEGRPGRIRESRTEGRITEVGHLPASQMAGLIAGAEGVISRSGYSTIMELVSLGRSALLVPTPGQTEQEYLADYLSEKGWFSSITQNGLRHTDSITFVSPAVPIELISESELLLEKALGEILKDQKDENHSGDSC